MGHATSAEWLPDPPPFQIRYIWTWFLELHAGRHSGPKGPLPITYQDMVSWSTLTNRSLSQFEIKTIRQLDQCFFFVLKDPAGSSRAAYLDPKAAEASIANIFRSFAKKKPAQKGMAKLPAPKIPVVNFKKK